MSTLIREDSFSIYAKVGGYIARPVFPRGWSPVCADGTAYQVGDKVETRHPGGPTARVGEEIWYLHGCYMAGMTTLSLELRISNYPDSDEVHTYALALWLTLREEADEQKRKCWIYLVDEDDEVLVEAFE